MGQATRNQELEDVERMAPAARLERLATQALGGIEQAAHAMEGIERTCTQVQLTSELSGMLVELRISAVKASTALRDLSMVAAVAKVVSKIAEEPVQ